jgi:hypothetical protein
MAAKTPPKPVTLPGTFRASIGYTAVLALFAIGGGVLMKTALASHKAQTIDVVGVLTGAFTVLFLIVLSTSVKVDDDGIVERSLVGKNVTPWDQVGTVDKMQNRGIGLKSAAGRNLTLITLMAANVQDTIADEAIRRGALRQVTDDKAKKKLRAQGILEQWTK